MCEKEPGWPLTWALVGMAVVMMFLFMVKPGHTEEHCIVVQQEGVVRGLSAERANTYPARLREFPCFWSDEEGVQDWLAHRNDWERSILGRRNG